MSRRDNHQTCESCGEFSSQVGLSVELFKLLCPECKAELERGEITPPISVRVPAPFSRRGSGIGDDTSPGWENVARAHEEGGWN